MNLWGKKNPFSHILISQLHCKSAELTGIVTSIQKQQQKKKPTNVTTTHHTLSPRTRTAKAKKLYRKGT